MSSIIQIDLSATVDISGVSELAKKLLDATRQADTEVQINSESVTRIDAAAMQMLAAFFKFAKALGYKVSWQNVSDQLKTAADLTGMTDPLFLADSA